MPILLLILLVGVWGYFIWRHRTTALTRDCRWRHDRGRGLWHCAFCGARVDGDGKCSPTACRRWQGGGGV